MHIPTLTILSALLATSSIASPVAQSSADASITDMDVTMPAMPADSNVNATMPIGLETADPFLNLKKKPQPPDTALLDSCKNEFMKRKRDLLEMDFRLTEDTIAFEMKQISRKTYEQHNLMFNKWKKESIAEFNKKCKKVNKIVSLDYCR